MRKDLMRAEQMLKKIKNPLKKVEGDENPDPIKENKSYKDKSNVERTETVNEDGTKTVSTTTYRKFGKHKGEVKLETDTDFKDGVGTGSQRIVKTKKSGEKKTKLATGRYQV